MSVVGNGWDDILRRVLISPTFKSFLEWIDNEYRFKTIYPPRHQVFEALHRTAFQDVKVVIIGQDPYINEGQAHGMAFSVNPGVKIPPSLMNIYKELQDELGCFIPNNGYLGPWADQGILLLNSILTVEKGKSGSHKDCGWELLTNELIWQLSKQRQNLVFMLWGKYAHTKIQFIDENKHLILEAAHPSPLAGGAFFGCGHFAKCQEFLYEVDDTVIDWQIPNLEVKYG